MGIWNPKCPYKRNRTRIYLNTLIDQSLSSDVLKYLESQHAMQRLGKAHEVASLALWLASDEASFATGTYYPIDGGYLAK